jgi:protein SCO1/2
MAALPKGRAALASAALLVTAIGLFALMQRAAAPAIGGPFQLVDAQNRIVTDSDFHGQDMLIYFGYTACPDVCPTTLASVVQALARLGARGDAIRPLFITVDPAHDTPPVMGRYAAAFSPRLVGLTGSPGQIRAVEAAYHVLVQPQSPSADGVAAITHSAVLYLMGPDGKFLAPLPPDATPATLATDLDRLLNRD